MLASLKDAEVAISKDGNNAKAFMRKGLALFEKQNFAESLVAFEKSRSINESRGINTWIRKCKAELEDGISNL